MLFSEIIGQQEIKKQLVNTVKTSRVSHAQLFYGAEGRGTLALAIAYAQFINCRDTEKFSRSDSCGICPSCIKYKKLIHPDLHFIFPVSTNQIVREKPSSKLFQTPWRELLIEKDYFISANEWYEKIQIEKKQALITALDCSDIIHTLSYTSYESEFKVMIIWMIERLYVQAAPKLLKILEEPPEKTLFLLITEQPDQIIPTIISRTQLVKIPKIEDTEIISACIGRFGLTRQEAINIARIANGSFKDALTLIHENESHKKRFERFVSWMRMCYAAEIAKILKFTEEIGRDGRENNKGFLQYGITVLRNCFVMNYTKTDIVKYREEELDFLRKFAPFIHHSNAERFADEFNKAIYHIERNVSPGMVFLDLSLTIAKLLKVKAT